MYFDLQCLSQVGPNFSMMATLFPNRKRKELKCKFKYEEKHHPALIEIALKASAAPLGTLTNSQLFAARALARDGFSNVRVAFPGMSSPPKCCRC